MEQKQRTDTERLTWVLQTIYESGADGLVKRLRYGYGEPPAACTVDEAMDLEEKQRANDLARRMACPQCGHVKECLP